MNHYTITKVGGKPQWENIPSLEVNNYQWLPELDIQMKAQICYSEEGIHVHLRAWEQNIRAEHTAPVSMVCEDSCMEFFFRPVDGDIRYFNLEINPKAQIYLGFGPNMPELVRLALQDEDALLQKRANYTDDGWEVFFTFPVSVIRLFYTSQELCKRGFSRSVMTEHGNKLTLFDAEINVAQRRYGSFAAVLIIGIVKHCYVFLFHSKFHLMLQSPHNLPSP